MANSKKKISYEGIILAISAPFNTGTSAPGSPDNTTDGCMGLMVIIEEDAFLSKRILKFFILDDNLTERRAFFDLYAQILLSKPGDQVEIEEDETAPLSFGRRIGSFFNRDNRLTREVE